MALVLCLYGAMFTPGTASAYIGEDAVVTGGDLTKPAEDVLTSPEFIPEIWHGGPGGGGGGIIPPEENTAWLDFLDGSGALPIVAPILAFGVGVGIGSEVCHSILRLEGCWFFHQDELDPAAGQEGSWTFFKDTPPFFSKDGYPDPPLYEWYWHPKGFTGFDFFWNGYGGDPGTEDSCGLLPPDGVDALVPRSDGTCEIEGVEVTVQRGALMKLQNGRRGLDYHAEDDPEISNNEEAVYCPLGGPCTQSPPADWTERAAGILEDPESAGISPGVRDQIGEKIASETPQGQEEGASDPYADGVIVPSCEGLKVSACSALMEELDLKPEVTELDWDEAVIEELNELEPEKTREEEAERVITIIPDPGTELDTESEVVIESNPNEEGMPEFVPKPDDGETAEEYKERKLGAPIFLPHLTELDDATLDPDKGPNEVVRTDPPAGTRVDPKSPDGSVEVDVQHNPATVPPGGYSHETCEATVGSVDWSPLNQPVGSKFPFGIVGFFVSWMGEWVGEAAPPAFDLIILPAGVFDSAGITWHIDLASVEAIVEPVRVAFLFLSFVGLLWFLGTAAAKVQGDSS